MELDDATREAVAAFVAELRHRREVAGLSQKALAKLVGYTPSYVSKVEGGVLLADGGSRSTPATGGGSRIPIRYRSASGGRGGSGRSGCPPVG